MEDAAEHMKVLELVRKEFRYLRLLWTHLSDSLSAHDEIVMAKSRLRLGDNITPETDEDGPPKKKSKRENENDVILEQYVSYLYKIYFTWYLIIYLIYLVLNNFNCF